KQATHSRRDPKEVDPDKLRRAIVHVQHDGRPARLILNRRPPVEGHAWLKYEDDGHEFAADLAQVQLVALLEG
ncbi:MAG TPA: transcriptional repressor KorB C-terminal beta-barrel domain-containing protein, partial [Denitromonas sp.]|nr:transcriptional repressor KorB C-terminal beta-barrel domain-containing protein [Denitromonas sp.]